MPEPLSWKMGLGMNVAVKPFCAAVFLTMYLCSISLSAIVTMLVELDADLALAGVADLVVVDVHLDAGSPAGW